MKKRNYIIPIFVPHIGCPNDCVFCNQRKITGISTDITGKDVRDKIEEYLITIPKKDRNLEVAFFGGSFTGIDIEVQKEFLDIAYSYKKLGVVDSIRLSTRPDYVDKDKLGILKDRGVDIIELGIQSLDPLVLEKSNRGHDRQSVFNAAKLIKEYGFTLGVQLMLGLPGDTREKALKTADELISLDPEIARIYPTLVIKETELENDYLKGKYEPLSLEESVDLTKDILIKFEYAGICVIRIGLQPSDSISDVINTGSEIVAGPFHPSFRQLVEEKIYFEIADFAIGDFLSSIKKNNGDLKINLVLEISSDKISYISGQKKANRNRYIQKYGIYSMSIKGITQRDIIRVSSGNYFKEFSIDEVKRKLFFATESVV